MTNSAPWAALGLPAGTATMVGSMPGTDVREAVRIVVGELPDLPVLPELPARGPGAGLIGRGAALFAELPVDLQPAGWRLVARPGLDLRRARDFLGQDLDAFEEALVGYRGLVKVAAAGPWTLAASVELPRGGAVLADPVAVRDLTESLAAGLVDHLVDLRRRLPDAAGLLLALDEPMLPAVLSGRIRSASGFSVLPVVEARAAVDGLAWVMAELSAAGAVAGVHCCAPSPPVGLLRSAGAAFLSLDATLLTVSDDEDLGEAVEAGTGLLLGCVPSTGVPSTGVPSTRVPSTRPGSVPGGPPMSDPTNTVEPARALWQRLGLDPAMLAEVVVLTPTCGLAGADPDYALAALRECRAGGRALVEAPESRSR